MNNLRVELKKLSVNLGLCETIVCTESEAKEFELLTQNGSALPNNITKGDAQGIYLKYIDTDLSDEEIRKLLLYRQIKYLKTINYSILFFVVLSAISLLSGAIIALSIFL